MSEGLETSRIVDGSFCWLDMTLSAGREIPNLIHVYVFNWWPTFWPSLRHGKAESFDPYYLIDMDVGYEAVLGGTEVIDLTHPLTSTTHVYPSDPTFVSIPHATHARDGYSVHKLVMGTHTGTHIDAPCHFVEGGRTIDEIDLASLIGEAVVIDLSTVALNDRQRIEWSQIKDKLNPPGTRILIIHTGWSKAYYQSERYLDHPYLAADIASHLLARGVNIVAVDTLNPDETPKPGEEDGADGFSFHKRYLGGGGLIVENLTNLDHLLAAQAQQPEARWIVSFIPLKLSGLDGSPIRAFASRT